MPLRRSRQSLWRAVIAFLCLSAFGAHQAQGEWQQICKLTADDAAEGDRFGNSVCGDVDGDGHIRVDDIFVIPGKWGVCDGCCLGDLNLDGIVDIDDLFEVLYRRGPCP